MSDQFKHSLLRTYIRLLTRDDSPPDRMKAKYLTQADTCPHAIFVDGMCRLCGYAAPARATPAGGRGPADA